MDCSSCLFSAAKKQRALPTAPRAYFEDDPEKAKRQRFELWSLLGLRRPTAVRRLTPLPEKGARKR
jgi:hypothetical protein